MAFNYTSLQASTTALIKNFGTQVVITSASTGKTMKTYAVYLGGTDTSDSSNQVSMFTKTTVGTEICYIGLVAVAPMPGDTVISKNRSHKIASIQSYQPADVLLAYKITLE